MRSIAYFTSLDVTTVPSSYLTFGLMWNVQVSPLSLTVPMSVARPGDERLPQVPGQALKVNIGMAYRWAKFSTHA